MEVTTKNFKEVLPLVEKSIAEADFLVIDTEFTGLMNGKDVSMFDTPQEYYMRLLNGCSDFLVLQYGLCAFHWNSEKKFYINDSYNFYLFPRGKPDKMFLCQSSSLDFLASQGFDFNKAIRNGISHMNQPTESRMRENLTERQKLYSNDKDNIKIPDDLKQQIEDYCKKVREFIDEKKADELEIDRCNAFVRRLLFQELGARFKSEVFLDTKILENKNRVLLVTRITEKNKNLDRDGQKKKKEWEEFEDAVGFSRVARMISQSNKLVIGHNMLMDVMHTLNHFFQPLPADYASFKEFTHCMFPRLLDTKFMSSLPPFKVKVNSTVLAHLYETLTEEPFSIPKVECEPDRGYHMTDEKEHEAGYDAYRTGLCFLAMHEHLAVMRGERNVRVNYDSPILKPFVNKLFLAKTAHQDSPYINLIGKDPSPSRDHVFHLTFPKEWQRNEINQLFSPFGPVTVQFLDDTAAIVSLTRREQAKDALRLLRGNSKITVTSFAKYKSQNKLTLDKPWRDLLPEKTSVTPETPRAVSSTVTKTVATSFSPLPEKVDRATYAAALAQPDRRRSLSVTPSPSTPATTAPGKGNRKRTSSGVFQVDNAEPPVKKSEVPRPSEDTRGASGDTRAKASNGRRKNSETLASEEDKSKKIIEKFDSSGNSQKCANAFQESDSWD